MELYGQGTRGAKVSAQDLQSAWFQMLQPIPVSLHCRLILEDEKSNERAYAMRDQLLQLIDSRVSGSSGLTWISSRHNRKQVYSIDLLLGLASGARLPAVHAERGWRACGGDIVHVWQIKRHSTVLREWLRNQLRSNADIEFHAPQRERQAARRA